MDGMDLRGEREAKEEAGERLKCPLAPAAPEPIHSFFSTTVFTDLEDLKIKTTFIERKFLNHEKN